MPAHYDTVVVGVGGMGSAAVDHLARRGVDVLGLERYDVPHAMGSSHGDSRIIRRPQFEDPAYVPLVERAFDLWDDLEDTHHRTLLHRTGSVDAGPAGGETVTDSLASCAEHDIPHEHLDADTWNDRHPGYDLPADFEAVYQADGGFLVPEECIVAHVNRAHDHGATVRAREAVTDWEPTADGGVRVTSEKDVYEADDLVVTAGAWAPKLVDALDGHAVPQRQVVGWFQPEHPERFTPETFPVFVVQDDDDHVYGFPVHDRPGFKIGLFEHFEEDVDPDAMPREPRPDDEAALRELTERFFPAAAGPTMRLETCIFTNTPDMHFVLDTLPEHPQVTVGAGFSGHGFKFASAVGEVLADLSQHGETDHQIDLFGVDRFD
jgi:sarcosine oxidase